MAIWTAVIWFIVRVPVLSELSAEVDPRVSTERSCLTMAPAAASIWEPLDRMAVSIAGSAVGMAAIMNATAVRNSSWTGTPRAMPRRIDAVSAKAARTRIWRVSALICFVSGVSSATVAESIPLMLPTWVSMPGGDDEDDAGRPG